MFHSFHSNTLGNGGIGVLRIWSRGGLSVKGMFRRCDTMSFGFHMSFYEDGLPRACGARNDDQVSVSFRGGRSPTWESVPCGQPIAAPAKDRGFSLGRSCRAKARLMWGHTEYRSHLIRLRWRSATFPSRGRLTGRRPYNDSSKQ